MRKLLETITLVTTLTLFGSYTTFYVADYRVICYSIQCLENEVTIVIHFDLKPISQTIIKRESFTYVKEYELFKCFYVKYYSIEK